MKNMLMVGIILLIFASTVGIPGVYCAQPPPSPSYPSDRWERIWYVYSGNIHSPAGKYLGLGPDQPNLIFDDDWGTGAVAYSRSEFIGFISSRTVGIKAGTSIFTVVCDDGLRLCIDDQVVIEACHETSTTTQTYDSTADHRLRLEWYEKRGTAHVGFSIQSVVFDTDDDGIPDDVEVHGYDYDNDGSIDVDLPAMGANPYHKDIFVEVDWMASGDHTHKPLEAAIQIAVSMFADAPVSNPDGTNGINLHVDAGQLGGGNELPHLNSLGSYGSLTGYDWTAFDQIKAQNFAPARHSIFHYCIFAHDLGGLDGTSGISRGIPSSDFIVSLGSWTNQVGTTQEQGGTFAHELGHNLGLKHGGGDNSNYKPNYLSIMSYFFQTSGLYKNGQWGHFDYSRFELPLLIELSLNEQNGLNGGEASAGFGTSYFVGTRRIDVQNANGPIDWDGDGKIESSVSADVNKDGRRSILRGYNDWVNLVSDGGEIGFGLMVKSELLPRYTPCGELTLEEYQKVKTAVDQVV